MVAHATPSLAIMIILHDPFVVVDLRCPGQIRVLSWEDVYQVTSAEQLLNVISHHVWGRPWRSLFLEATTPTFEHLQKPKAFSTTL